jgi:hypothetical protein
MNTLTKTQQKENEKRAERGFKIFLTYRARHDKGNAHQDVLSDLLADLMHHVDEYGIDFDECLDTARMNYHAEKNGED